MSLKPLTGDRWNIYNAIVLAACSEFLHRPFVKVTTIVYRRFMTRRIAVWPWLPENGPSKVFSPLRAHILPIIWLCYALAQIDMMYRVLYELERSRT